jgi:hypothetical protein
MPYRVRQGERVCEMSRLAENKSRLSVIFRLPEQHNAIVCESFDSELLLDDPLYRLRLAFLAARRLVGRVYRIGEADYRLRGFSGGTHLHYLHSTGLLVACPLDVVPDDFDAGIVETLMDKLWITPTLAIVFELL